MDILFIPTVYSSKNGALVSSEEEFFDAPSTETAADIDARLSGSSRAVPDGVSSGSDIAALADLVTTLSAELKAVKDRLAEVEKK